MKAIAVSAVAAILGIGSLPQTTPPKVQSAPPPLTERIEVSIVNVDVTVLDHDGQPVIGLTPDDFEVYEDGKPQRITNFSAIVKQMPAVTRTPAARPETTQPKTSEQMHRRVLVMVDELSLEDHEDLPLQGKPERDSAVGVLQRFVEERFVEGDEWSVVKIGRDSRTLLPFSSDRDAVKDALMRARGAASIVGSTFGRPDGVGISAHAIGVLNPHSVPTPSGASFSPGRSSRGSGPSVDATAALSFQGAVIQAAHAMGSLNGKKAIVLVTSYVPGYEPPAVGSAASDQIELARAHARMVREANAANVNVFVLDPRGVGGDFERAQRLTAGAYWLSAETGGAYLPSNRVAESLKKFDTATTNYYELGYPTSSDDGRYHTIRVRLKRAGHYDVRHRNGYVRVSPEAAFEEGMNSTLVLSTMKTTLPLDVDVDEFKVDAGGTALVPLHASISLGGVMMLRGSDGRIGRLHVYVSVFDQNNVPIVVRHFVETLSLPDEGQKDIVVSKSVALRKGTYHIFVTVRDELGEQVGVAAREVAF